MLGFLAVHLALAAGLPLTEDEAYYRLWAQAPAFGYFDHPPVIAWLIRAGVAVAGDSRLGVRLAPCLLSGLTTLLVFDLTRALGGEARTALRAGLWFNLTLLSLAGGMLAVPDAPAEAAWVACLCALARTPTRPGWWLAAGAAAGIGALSKYSALFLAPGALIWLLASQEGRAALRRPWPWLALGLASMIFALNLIWNAGHGWVTLARQFGRLTPHRFAPIHLPEFLAAQVLLLNPVIAVFAVKGLSPGKGKLWRKVALPAIVGLPFAGYLLLHALHDQVEAHWPAPLYPSLAVIAAFAAEGQSRFRRWAAPLAFGALGLAIGVYMAPALGIRLPLDPAKSIRDLPGFKARVAGLAARSHAAWIGAASYGLAAELLDDPEGRLTPLLPVLQIRERVRWRGLVPSGADLTRPGLVIDLARRLSRQGLDACFGEVTPLGVLTRGAPGAPQVTYSAYLVAEPKVNVLTVGCP
ncbi:MAG: glycosyltransferase family 39 protein [Alphaproteobacteria bacterium]|nr:glycosyltransferase family 39 protein [Alphaproteobacteria bacterium]